MSSWQPIATAPKTGQRLLLRLELHGLTGPLVEVYSGRYSVDPYITKDGEVIGAEEGFQCDGDQCIPSNQNVFTHWQPLPSSALETILPHLDTCNLKAGGSKCTCGLLSAKIAEGLSFV